MPVLLHFRYDREMSAPRSAHNRDSRQPLREVAYETILERIAAGELGPGAILSPRKLGEEMGMSFLPVADALKQLERQGLVESKDRVGTRVKVPTVEDVEGLCNVREALESQVARLTAERATDGERKQIVEMAIEVDRRYASPMTSRKMWTETNSYHTRFHRLVAECAHCPALLRAVDSTNVFTLKILFEGVLTEKVRPAGFHEKYARCIVAGDPEAADRAARAHLAYGVPGWLAIVEQLEPQRRWRL